MNSVLTDLVQYKNQLEQWSSEDLKYSVDSELAKITQLVKNESIQLDDFGSKLQQQQIEITQAFEKFESVLDSTKSKLNELICAEEPNWFAASSELYNQYIKSLNTNQKIPYIEFGVVKTGVNPATTETHNKNIQHILNRDLYITEDTEQLISSRILNYADWKYPAAIIRPGKEKFIDALVANDPLYLLDDHTDLLDYSITQFNTTYQRRLRPYVIDIVKDCSFDMLPDAQFGFFFIYNYFNYMPVEYIQRYLEEIFEKLRPGGVVGMTINDCDQSSAVMLAERSFACYTPGRLIQNMIEKIGYKILYKHNDSACTWMEIGRPGELFSLRGGQTLAKICAK